MEYLGAIRSLALPSLLDKLPELEARGSLLKGSLEPVRLQLEMFSSLTSSYFSGEGQICFRFCITSPSPMRVSGVVTLVVVATGVGAVPQISLGGILDPCSQAGK